MITVVLEQSSNMRRHISEKCTTLLFSLILLFFKLSNVFKGENISNLTIEPGLVPFDTFDSLVKNNFSVRSRKCVLAEASVSNYIQNAQVRTDFFQENGHEAFPVVSELLYVATLPLYLTELNRLAVLKNRLSQKTVYYLDHSEMLPLWPDTSDDLIDHETIEQVLSMHMGKCNQTAIILRENMALQLFTILKAAKQPVFFGRDIIIGNLMGYNFKGYFPEQILLRIRSTFNSGIVEWWQKYVKWFVVLKTKKDYDTGNLTEFQRLTNRTIDGTSKSGVYVLCLIPGFGLLLSFAVFICFDCSAIKSTMWGIWSLVKTGFWLKRWLISKYSNFCCSRRNQNTIHIKRFSWPEILEK